MNLSKDCAHLVVTVDVPQPLVQTVHTRPVTLLLLLLLLLLVPRPLPQGLLLPRPSRPLASSLRAGREVARGRRILQTGGDICINSPSKVRTRQYFAHSVAFYLLRTKFILVKIQKCIWPDPQNWSLLNPFNRCVRNQNLSYPSDQWRRLG